MTRLSATEVARNFSDVLNRVAAGEEIEIVRHGSAVAFLSRPRARYLTARRFREVMAVAPPIDASFADDVRAIRRGVGPPESAWPS